MDHFEVKKLSDNLYTREKLYQDLPEEIEVYFSFFVTHYWIKMVSALLRNPYLANKYFKPVSKSIEQCKSGN
jgi:hypothetical protein